jgi:hypothetical protein
MSDLEQRATDLRTEIASIKGRLAGTIDEAERYQLHTRLNACIRESLALIDQRLQASRASLTEPLRERRVGD